MIFPMVQTEASNPIPINKVFFYDFNFNDLAFFIQVGNPLCKGHPGRRIHHLNISFVNNNRGDLCSFYSLYSIIFIASVCLLIFKRVFPDIFVSDKPAGFISLPHHI